MDENPFKYTYFWLRHRYFVWREKLARTKYRWDCKRGNHITFDAHSSFKQIWNNGKPFTRLISHGRIPIMYCHRCKKRVNIGLEDEYFSGKKS